MEAGDDGQPNFHARKACDYLKSAVEVIFQTSSSVCGRYSLPQDCGNMLVGACYSEVEVRRQKDEQVSQKMKERIEN